MRIKKRYHLKKKDLKKVKEKLGVYADLLSDKAQVEMLQTDVDDLILVEGEPLIMILDGEPYPALKGALKRPLKSHYVVVDMGAVKFVAKGADVMSPGIVEADSQIMEGDVVVVVEETHRKPLSIGRALLSGDEMVENNQGKAIKTLHYVGDKIWNLEI
ncbi:MAG: RNA-binding protein [Methanobacteriales archaeon Met13]